ncbi:MAG: hypothetical protein ACK5AZ_08860 [Bryobacteraceae bacterium]
MFRSIALGLTLLTAGAMHLAGQTGGQAHLVELAVPFGTVSGKLLLLPEHLVFVDEEKPEYSFVVARTDARRENSATDVLSISVQKPVRDRSGERSRISFRLLNDANFATIGAWFDGKPIPASAAAESAAAAPAPADNENGTTKGRAYNARHNHRIGSCRGRLIVADDRLVYESIDNLSHSRRWALRDLKELKLSNPYELSVDPFNGSGYKIHFEGEAMESTDFRQLVDRVTAARQ